ncbi:MAG: inositol-3-phosphate synthase [Planctomycetales bacterium]|nr:inositol-3-phosphate synthase [Planctomycetales bacterium]
MAKKIGIWFVGARGGVATTAAVGLAALNKGLISTTGLVTELPAFSGAGLAAWRQLVTGGHDVRQVELRSAARQAGLPDALIAECENELRDADQRIRPGFLFNSGPAVQQMADRDYARRADSPRAVIEAIQSDLRDFQESQALGHVVVMLLTATEPPTEVDRLPRDWPTLSETLDSAAACPLRASSLYAIAALDLGFSFVNFTPSLGSSCGAIEELARLRGACHAGRDGKTGETLLKTVLAPMFASRNLEVMSWVGHNILGNSDGQVLAHPEHKQSKLTTKDSVLGALLGHDPQTVVSIECVESLAERKTAWNHVHFRGFLGVDMTLQLTWQGHDSALAAPLVLDLARLVERSARRGEQGAIGALASFFKTPLGAPLEDHSKQFEKLLAHYA